MKRAPFALSHAQIRRLSALDLPFDLGSDQHGHPVRVIFDVAEAENVGSALMSSHGRGALAEALLGSTVGDVARHSRRPALIARRERRKRRRRFEARRVSSVIRTTGGPDGRASGGDRGMPASLWQMRESARWRTPADEARLAATARGGCPCRSAARRAPRRVRTHSAGVHPTGGAGELVASTATESPAGLAALTIALYMPPPCF